MITTVTLNPMLDKTLHVASLRRGVIERAAAMEMVVGGKGINVSRQLLHLGCPTLATGFFGGEIGALLERLLDEEGVPHNFIHIKALTREGLTFLETDGVQTSVFEPPAPAVNEEVDRLIEHVLELAKKSRWVVCSGSSPSGSADNVFADVVKGCHDLKVLTAVDSYGRAMRLATESLPTIVKMNRDEYRASFGTALDTEPAILEALKRYVVEGSTLSIITDGARPAYAASTNTLWRIISPHIVAVNPTGSGDAMLAGILFGLTEGWPMKDCLAFGAAAGATNASRWEVARVPRQEIEAVVEQVVVEQL